MADSASSSRKDRDESGKFVKGHKVPSPRTGRKKADSYPILVAITQMAYTPEELVEMLHETYVVAQKSEDAKAMMQVIQFVVNYAIGKPVQRTLSATIDPEQLKEIFGGSDYGSVQPDGQELRDGNTIAGEGSVVE